MEYSGRQQLEFLLKDANEKISTNLKVISLYKDATISIDSRIAELIQLTALWMVQKKRIEAVLKSLPPD